MGSDQVPWYCGHKWAYCTSSWMIDKRIGHKLNDNWQVKSEVLWGKPASVSVCPPQIPCKLPWDWTWACMIAHVLTWPDSRGWVLHVQCAKESVNWCAHCWCMIRPDCFSQEIFTNMEQFRLEVCQLLNIWENLCILEVIMLCITVWNKLMPSNAVYSVSYIFS
jgi:hypothetical protein